MKPKIIIDSISLLSPLTGIGRYTYEISKKLEEKENLECNFFYGYHSNKLIHPSEKNDLKSIKSIIVKNSLIKRIVRKTLIILNKIYTPKYDVYWQPNFIPNDGIKAKKIVTTVHDFSFILHEEFHPRERIDYFKKYFFKNIIKSDVIITGSEFSKREIHERLDFKDEQIKVIYHGLNREIFKIYEDNSLNFDLPKKFIFSVGSIEPRKNLIGLLKAYNLLEQKIKDEYKLVLAGFKGWENNEIMDLINKDKENIYYIGFISDSELAKVYNQATLFVFPSFYEGFGLPIIESMSCGTPIVCSNTTSLPEVGGEAVVYCNPNDIVDIKNKIKLVLYNESLQKIMIEKGLERSKKFSWEKSANAHYKILNEVLQS